MSEEEGVTHLYWLLLICPRLFTCTGSEIPGLVIPDIGYRESILNRLRMDPR